MLLSSEASGKLLDLSSWGGWGKVGSPWSEPGDRSPVPWVYQVERGLKEEAHPGQLPQWPWCSAALWFLPVPEIPGALACPA